MVLSCKLHCKQRQDMSMPYDVALKTAVEVSATQANSTSEEQNTSVDRNFTGVYELAPKGKVRSNTTEIPSVQAVSMQLKQTASTASSPSFLYTACQYYVQYQQKVE